MQLISAKILARGRGRRTAEKGREGPDVPDVVFLHLLLESARRHVVDHALAQRADGLVGHRESSCLAWGCEPHDLETGPRPSRFSSALAFLQPYPAAPTARAV